MSMNKIAKRAGIAQPSFYNHFESLEALQSELSAQLKANYLSLMRMAWVDMLKDYPTLTCEQFNQRCQHCLNIIFDAAFQNIALFHRLIEDSLRMSSKTKSQDSPTTVLIEENVGHKGLGTLITEIQAEWTKIFIQGLESSGRTVEYSEVNLCVDIAAAQVHELILGCYRERYLRAQAIDRLCKNFHTLFGSFLCEKENS